MGRIHAARIENSPRLQRLHKLLSDGRECSTREIIREADVCAVNTAIGELRDPKNGCVIACRRVSRYYYYKLLEDHTQQIKMFL